jgi:hypothetical protein
MEICKQLRDFLNGGARPEWLDELQWIPPHKLMRPDGFTITVEGPLYDSDPPNLFWKQREDEEAKRARTKLLEELFGVDDTGEDHEDCDDQ